MNVTVDDLEYEIMFRHSQVRENYPGRFGISGSTICFITVSENHPEVAVGAALCSSKDNFCRATGRKISLGRALLKAFPNKEDRRYIWEQYFKKMGVVHQ